MCVCVCVCVVGGEATGPTHIVYFPHVLDAFLAFPDFEALRAKSSARGFVPLWVSFPRCSKVSLMFFDADASLCWVCVALRGGQRTAYLWCFFSLKSTGWLQLLQNREVTAGWSPTPRPTLALAPSAGFLVQHVEVLLAWRRSSCKRKKKKEEEEMKQTVAKSSLCTRMKQHRQKAHYSSFSSRRARGGKTASGRYYDECSQTGGKLLLTRNELRAYHP